MLTYNFGTSLQPILGSVFKRKLELEHARGHVKWTVQAMNESNNVTTIFRPADNLSAEKFNELCDSPSLITAVITGVTERTVSKERPRPLNGQVQVNNNIVDFSIKVQVVLTFFLSVVLKLTGRLAANHGAIPTYQRRSY